MENEEDAPQEVLEVGPKVHLAQYPVNDDWKKASTQRHLPLTCSSGELLLILATLITLSLFDSQRKTMSLNCLLPIIVSFDGQCQGRKSNSQTSESQTLTNLLPSEVRCLDTKFELIQMFLSAHSSYLCTVTKNNPMLRAPAAGLDG